MNEAGEPTAPASVFCATYNRRSIWRAIDFIHTGSSSLSTSDSIERDTERAAILDHSILLRVARACSVCCPVFSRPKRRKKRYS